MKRLIKATLWLVGSYLLFCLVALGAMLWGELNAQHVGDGSQADVALVLGAMQDSDGSLHPSTQRRVDRAVEFYQAGQISVLVMCGGAPGEGRVATAALTLVARLDCLDVVDERDDPGPCDQLG